MAGSMVPGPSNPEGCQNMGNAQIYDRVKVLKAVGERVYIEYENRTPKDYEGEKAGADEILRHNKAGRQLLIGMEDACIVDEMVGVEGGMENFMKDVLLVSKVLFVCEMYTRCYWYFLVEGRGKLSKGFPM